MNDNHESKPLAQEGYDLMSAAFEVHSIIGGGLLEEIYQESLEIELNLRGIPFRRKCELQVNYKGHLLNKRYIPGLIVSNVIVVELKSISSITAETAAQLMNYMRISKSVVGYLINFGPMKKLQWKRFVFSEYLPKKYQNEADR